MTDQPDSAQLRVMMLPNDSRPGGNPFVGLLVGSLDAGITTVPFTWKYALTGAYDVFHAHWPEYLLAGRNSADRALRVALLQLLTIRLRLRRKPWLVTFHNQAPHDGLGRLGMRAYRRFVSRAAARVFMNRVDSCRTDFRDGDAIIPHGDYRSTAGGVSDIAQVTSEEGRVILFGSLRPYKGVEGLIDLFRVAKDLRLEVVGRADDPSYARTLETRAAEVANVNLHVGELTDSDLAHHVRRAQFVVLPYKDLYNSGAAFLALTLGRPLLLPESPTSVELAQEFGADRVMTYQAPLTPDVLVEAASRLGADEAPVGGLGDERAWPRIGHRYSELYRSIVNRDGMNVHG